MYSIVVHGRTMKTDDLTINYRDEQVYDDTNSKIVIFCLETS